MLIILSNIAMATPDDVYSDEFNSYTGSGCDSAWTGDCLSGWTSDADDDTLSMSYCSTQLSTNDYGVTVDGGGASINGFKKTYSLTSRVAGWLTVSVKTWAVSGTVTATIRAQLLNSSGVVLHTITEDLNPDSNDSDFTNFTVEVADSNVTAIRLAIGATGTSVLWVDEVAVAYSDEEGPQTAQECIDQCVCPAGFTKTGCQYTWSNPPPSCSVNVQCAPNSGVDEPPANTSSWTSF